MQWWGGGGVEHSLRMTDRLVRIQEQAKPQNPKQKPTTNTSATSTDAKLLTIQCSRLWSGGRAHCDSGANGGPAQACSGEETYWSIL